MDAPRLLDGFEDPGLWEAKASDGVIASAAPVTGVEDGRALRLDFDFNGVGGYAFARRALPFDLPMNYEISFWLRADAPVNHFEVKFTDSSGENVWWSQRRDFTFPTEWRRIKIKKRQISFAWGPASDRELKRAEKIEFVVAAGRDGGRGSIEIDDLQIRELPVDPPRFPKPVTTATSFIVGGEPAFAVDGASGTAWMSNNSLGVPQSLTLDLGLMREFGGLELDWAEGEGAFPARYDIAVSDDGTAWRTIRRVSGANGGRDWLRLPEQEARFIRIDLLEGPGDRYALAGVDIKDLSFGQPNAFVEAIAREKPRGHYPRGFSGEQPYWTVVGVDGGDESGLLSEDGALEAARGGFSVEPFVVMDGKLVTWAEVAIDQSLRDAYLPIPTVTWRDPRWNLTVTAFASGDAASSQLLSRYTVTNRTDKPISLKLALAVRPLQVNPPTQSLNIAGGVSPIHALAWDGARVSVNGRARITPLAAPAPFAASAFDGGTFPEKLLGREGPNASATEDETGLASGALVYEIALEPRASATVGLAVPLSGEPDLPNLAGTTPADWLAAKEREVAGAWRAKLNHVSFDVPAAGQRVVDTLRSSLAHILMSRNGPILRPGTRAYARSWIRDGAMISESLVRLGHANIAADFLRWFAPHQFANGKVPCCVDPRGADPVPENDSHGQLIFLAAEVYRFTGDRTLLEAVWPQVELAARYLNQLRLSERTDKNRAPERRMLFGLLPPSISHEGYASKPAYSYWDNFWGLTGYKDAFAIANILGHAEAANRMSRERDEYRADLYASLRASSEAHGVPYLSGAADLGDFDATSTTIALAPGGELGRLPEDLLFGTFERYWANFIGRRDGTKAWNDYTPYELRNAGAFVRLGWRERTHELLDFFFKDRRPRGWNQWAEVVGRVPREQRFIGDMPHAWVASDYIRSALDLFAYSRERDGALVLGAGLPKSWLESAPIGVTGLKTAYGPLSYAIKAEKDRLVVTLAEGSRPPGGFVLSLPVEEGAYTATLDGQPLPWRDGELRVAAAPATVILEKTAPSQ